MVSRGNYENEIDKYVDNLDASAKDMLVRNVLKLIFHPEVNLETDNYGLEDDFMQIEICIDEFNEQYTIDTTTNNWVEELQNKYNEEKYLFDGVELK